MFAALRLIPPREQQLSNENKEEADGGKKQGKCTAVGEGVAWMLSVEAVGKGRKGIEAGAANHLHTRWGVRQARGTYGCRPLTQQGEHILPSIGNAEYC